MPGITLESAIVAAIIAFFGALLGQITGAFFGARYAADVNRRTQLEIADLSFKRQWRERLVRPFLETANTRMALVSQFTKAVSAGEQQVALDIASEFRNIDTVIHNADFAALGDAQLTEAADAWEELESRAASTFLNIASGPKLGPEQSQLKSRF